MNGVQTYNNNWETKTRKRISGYNPKYMLSGFYNSLIIAKAPSTADQYMKYIENFVRELERNRIYPEELTLDDYTRFLVTEKSKSSSVQRNAYSALQLYSKYLRAKGVSDDYMLYVDCPKKVETEEQKERREKKVLTKQEVGQIMTATKNSNKSPEWKSRDEAIIKVMLNTGCRAAALYKLDVQDVDFQNLTIRVMEKGSKSRKINITEETAEAIKEWLVYRKMILEDQETPALFISAKRNRLDYSQYLRMVKRNAAAAGVKKNVTPHTFRSTFGTTQYMASGDIYYTQQAMGHASPQTTELYIRGNKQAISAKASDVMKSFMQF